MKSKRFHWLPVVIAVCLLCSLSLPARAEEWWYDYPDWYVEKGVAYIGNCREWVNVRGDPSTDNDPIGRAYLGEKVTVVDWDRSGTWARVVYNNGRNAGWVRGDFLV